MRYLFLIYGAEDAWTEAERQDCLVRSLAVCDELAAGGKYRDASPLQPAATATTVRVRDGRPLVTAGPFAETAEQLGGYYVLDLADLDEAIAVAGRLPPVHKGAVEIRPLVEVDGLPPTKPTPPGEPYLLLAYHAEDGIPDGALAESVALAHRLAAAGQYLSASPLRPAATATTVRVRDGKRLITDGPFAEAREVLGGYFLILAPDRAAAERAAAEFPASWFGAVEVRQLFDLSTL